MRRVENDDERELGLGRAPAAMATRDVWAFGLVAFEVFTGRSLFRCDTTGNLASEGEVLRVGDWALQNCLNAMHELDFELEVRQVPPRDRLLVADLVSSLLHPDPENRPTSFEQVLRHGLLNGTATSPGAGSGGAKVKAASFAIHT